MTIEELKKIAEERMDDAVADLRQNGTVHQTFHLFHADGHVTVIMVDGTVTNDEAAKSALGDRIRAMIANDGVVAVVMVSDIFWANMTPENNRLRRRLGLNVEASAAMGLCTKHEAVLVTLESPIYTRHLRQNYERDGAKVTLTKREDEDSTSGNFGVSRARFSGLFAEPTKGASA